MPVYPTPPSFSSRSIVCLDDITKLASEFSDLISLIFSADDLDLDGVNKSLLIILDELVYELILQKEKSN